MSAIWKIIWRVSQVSAKIVLFMLLLLKSCSWMDASFWMGSSVSRKVTSCLLCWQNVIPNIILIIILHYRSYQDNGNRGKLLNINDLEGTLLRKPLTNCSNALYMYYFPFYGIISLLRYCPYKATSTWLVVSRAKISRLGSVGRHINKNINRSQDKSSGKSLNFMKGVWSWLNESFAANDRRNSYRITFWDCRISAQW